MRLGGGSPVKTPASIFVGFTLAAVGLDIVTGKLGLTFRSVELMRDFKISFAILTPLIVVICGIGAYAVNNALLDVWYMLIFGVIGYVFKKLDYPLTPLVLALVLGDMAETAIRQGLVISQGSPLIFFWSPIAAVITAVALFFFFLPALSLGRRRLKAPPAPAASHPDHTP